MTGEIDFQIRSYLYRFGKFVVLIQNYLSFIRQFQEFLCSNALCRCRIAVVCNRRDCSEDRERDRQNGDCRQELLGGRNPPPWRSSYSFSCVTTSGLFTPDRRDGTPLPHPSAPSPSITPLYKPRMGKDSAEVSRKRHNRTYFWNMHTSSRFRDMWPSPTSCANV